MPSITIEELKKKQKVLSKHILGLVQMFEDETATKVDSVFFEQEPLSKKKTDAVISLVM